MQVHTQLHQLVILTASTLPPRGRAMPNAHLYKTRFPASLAIVALFVPTPIFITAATAPENMFSPAAVVPANIINVFATRQNM